MSPPAYTPPADVPPPPAFEPPAPPVFTTPSPPAYTPVAAELPDFTPAPAFTPQPSFANTENYPPASALAPVSDEPFVPHADPARTIAEERAARQLEEGTREAYAPLGETAARAWPPLAQAPELGGTPIDTFPTQTTQADPAHSGAALDWGGDPAADPTPPAPMTPPTDLYAALASEDVVRSMGNSPLPHFLNPETPVEPPAPANPPSQVPATADRFAELVYAARNKSIEFEPDALREHAPNRAPLLALVLVSLMVAVSLLQYRSIETFLPFTTGIFKAVGLR